MVAAKDFQLRREKVDHSDGHHDARQAAAPFTALQVAHSPFSADVSLQKGLKLVRRMWSTADENFILEAKVDLSTLVY